MEELACNLTNITIIKKKGHEAVIRWLNSVHGCDLVAIYEISILGYGTSLLPIASQL